MFVWRGVGASDEEMEASKHVVSFLGGSVTNVSEGKEQGEYVLRTNILYIIIILLHVPGKKKKHLGLSVKKAFLFLLSVKDDILGDIINNTSLIFMITCNSSNKWP